MARYTGPVCRLCRRENVKLFLKGERCYTDKCAIERRNYPPGQHGQRRPKFSEYSLQLREKQKAKRMYGLLEKQFKGAFTTAEKARGITGENLLVNLERRLDNVVYRLGFACSRADARLLLRHGHILVNGRRVTIASYRVRVNGAQRRGMPDWVEVDQENFAGTIKVLPTRNDITTPINEKLIVELYSK